VCILFFWALFLCVCVACVSFTLVVACTQVRQHPRVRREYDKPLRLDIQAHTWRLYWPQYRRRPQWVPCERTCPGPHGGVAEHSRFTVDVRDRWQYDCPKTPCAGAFPYHAHRDFVELDRVVPQVAAVLQRHAVHLFPLQLCRQVPALEGGVRSDQDQQTATTGLLVALYDTPTRVPLERCHLSVTGFVTKVVAEDLQAHELVLQHAELGPRQLFPRLAQLERTATQCVPLALQGGVAFRVRINRKPVPVVLLCICGVPRHPARAQLVQWRGGRLENPVFVVVHLQCGGMGLCVFVPKKATTTDLRLVAVVCVCACILSVFFFTYSTNE
jgi:hypothetical protein